MSQIMKMDKKVSLIIATVAVLVLAGVLLAMMLSSGTGEADVPKDTSLQTDEKDTTNEGLNTTDPNGNQTVDSKSESTPQGESSQDGNSQNGNGQSGSNQGGTSGNQKDDDLHVEINTGEKDPADTDTTNPSDTTKPSGTNPPVSGGTVNFDDLLAAAGK